MDDLTLPELVAEFPGWAFRRSTIDLLWYAQREATVVRGEDLTDLRDEIRRALADR